MTIDSLAKKYPAHSPYMYVGGNPVKYTDPDGDKCWLCIAVGIIVGFVTASKPATAPTLNKAADDRATQQAYDDYHRDLLSAAALPSKEVKAASKVLDLAKKEVKQEAKEGASKVVKEAAKGGSKGTQVNSKTLWKGNGKERIDVENPNPSHRPGQVHYQDNEGGKYIYDPSTGTFKDAPKSVNGLLQKPEFKKAIEKGLEYLGY